MSYLEEFQLQIENENYQGCLQLWEEYCGCDEVDGQELCKILELIERHPPMAQLFGPTAESALPLWRKVTDPEQNYRVFRQIIDLETTNSTALADLTFDFLKERYGQQTHFNEKIRLVGLRNRKNFQGAVRNYDLLSHMDKGKFVFHTAGWGVGEIVDISLVREQLLLEFEGVGGRKEIAFDKAFKTLRPMASDHFLARRFGDPDSLEHEARQDPTKVIRLLLRDLGPKTAAEIKNELCEYVIPAADWSRWWQLTRTKLKKDTLVEAPATTREPFRLRSAELAHEERLVQELAQKQGNVSAVLQKLYAFTRDFPETLKNNEFKQSLIDRLHALTMESDLSHEQQLTVAIFLEDLAPEKLPYSVESLLRQHEQIEELINRLDILAFKKRVLVALRRILTNWSEVFLKLLWTLQHAPLRDYLVKELCQPSTMALLEQKLKQLLAHPAQNPELLVWYFQKAISKDKEKDEPLPYSDRMGQSILFEGLLVLLSAIEQKMEYRELVKKIYNLLTKNRYATIRSFLDGSSIDFAQEFLLLITKCTTFTDHDIKIMHALAEVVHPSLAKQRKRTASEEEPEVIWTTQEGYNRLQARLQHMSSVEIIENAKEIEEARAHGDLRENAEYKAALERRARLQNDIQVQSKQLNRARIITEYDVMTDEVSVGSVITLLSDKGEKVEYTLLGPWDVDLEKNILSIHSKFAQSMVGKIVGDKIRFQEQEFTIQAIRSFMDKKA